MAGNLTKRALTGFPLAAALAALVLWAPTELLLVATSAILLLAAAEWAALTGLNRLMGPAVLLPALAAIWYLMHSFAASDFIILSVTALFWFFIIFEILSTERQGQLDELPPISTSFVSGIAVLCGFYAGVMHLLVNPEPPFGWQVDGAFFDIGFARWFLAGLITMGVFADTGGYFAGRRFGRTLLSPIVSPGKTWAGFIGSIAAGMSIPVALYFLLPLTQWLTSLTLALALISLGLYGDLWESLRKRYSGVKDSGSILAGHGGVLDRIDSHLCILPMAAFFSSLRELLL